MMSTRVVAVLAVLLCPCLPAAGAEWGDSVVDLHREYYNIFKNGNRNAASHLWSSFLLDRSETLTHEKFTYLMSGYCAVSGSQVQPQDRTRYRLNLQTASGGTRRGFMYYCCWPCVCDTQDFIRVDTRNVTLLGGKVRQYHFAVLGDPCQKPDELSKPFIQPFYGNVETTIRREAPDLICDDQGQLTGAHRSAHGHIIISMFFDEDQALKSMDESIFAGHCADRAANGYNSGMGEIFRKVAQISSPVPTSPALGAPNGEWSPAAGEQVLVWSRSKEQDFQGRVLSLDGDGVRVRYNEDLEKVVPWNLLGSEQGIRPLSSEQAADSCDRSGGTCDARQ